jgi:hypothetical protein
MFVSLVIVFVGLYRVLVWLIRVLVMLLRAFFGYHAGGVLYLERLGNWFI